ncbi:MAG: hypothetical protein GY765_00940 [bacterium]|nr:hypothetical protein [bacterium]
MNIPTEKMNLPKPGFLLVLMLFCGCLFTLSANSGLQIAPLPAERMEEWSGMRFGMFIHWGPWSQTGKGAIWDITKNKTPEEGAAYFQLNRTFKPVKFNPAAWAALAKEAGMKYVVFTAKHHDGFCNFDTALSGYKSTGKECPNSMYPDADLAGAVVREFRKKGLGIGIYYSHIDWHHADGKYMSRGHWDYAKKNVDTNPDGWKRFVDYQNGQVRELLTNYGNIDIFWFDIYWPYASRGKAISHPGVLSNVVEMLTMMRRLQPGLIINNRGTHLWGDFFTPEQKVPQSVLPGYWEVCMTISKGKGFWYKGEKASYKTPRELIHLLVDVVGKGGNFLLNVGPRPDGTLPQKEIDALKAVGEWMSVNGSSIYGTKPQTGIQFRYPWGRCTVKKNAVYLHVLQWPKNGTLHFSMPHNKEIKSIRFLADEKRPLSLTKTIKENVNPETGEKRYVLNVGTEAVDDFDSVIAMKTTDIKR